MLQISLLSHPIVHVTLLAIKRTSILLMVIVTTALTRIVAAAKTAPWLLLLMRFLLVLVLSALKIVGLIFLASLVSLVVVGIVDGHEAEAFCVFHGGAVLDALDVLFVVEGYLGGVQG